MKFDEAIEELASRLGDPVQQAKQVPKPQEEAAGLAMLQSMMGASDFRGKAG